jgi:hypothetical protein
VSARETLEARRWISLADAAHAKIKHRPFTGGAESNVIRLALLEGRLEEASQELAKAEREIPALRSTRNRLVAVAFRLQIDRLRGKVIRLPDVLDLLRCYPRMAAFTQFDDLVSALWHGLVAHGRRDEALTILTDYMTKRRRVFFPPIWELQEVLDLSGTARDGITNPFIGGHTEKEPDWQGVAAASLQDT